jgi:subfamily B ATP-binding cassette protein MsbA
VAGKTSQLYRRLLTYSRPHSTRIVLAIVGSIGVAGVDVASAQLVRPLFDKIIAAGNYTPGSPSG